ncbi:MAG: DNA cytosine methyltransferase [Polyangiales bacterium]
MENVLEFGASPGARRWRGGCAGEYRGRAFVLDGADFGCAQSRRRRFEVWVRGARQVPRWRPPTLAPDARRPLLDVLEAGAPWSPVDAAARRAVGLRPLAPKTLRQVAAGVEAYRGGLFVVRYNGSQRARSVVYSPARPLGALTTRDRFCLARGGAGAPAEIRRLTLREQARLFDLPERYSFAGVSHSDGVKLCGNALVSTVLAWLWLRTREVIG